MKNRIFKAFGTLLCAFLCVFSLVGCGELPFLEDLLDRFGPEESFQSSSAPEEDIPTDALSIHFPELGNKYTGDCTLIKAGDTEVLIDAGSRAGSAATLVPYIERYCTDGKLEYVVATHAHQDHISGFVGTAAAPGIFESFECGVIIDFPRTNATSSVYNNYVEERDKEVRAGARHYTALECWKGQGGAQRTYELAQGVSMSILYNVFYEEESSDENNYSVCLLVTRGSEHYLFTGDLEKEGEEALAENNSLPHCKLFKGGHHGSYTANTDALLSVIRPEIVCVCCCCGSDEYTENVDNMFPSQAFVDRVGKYTDKIYVTTLVSDNERGYESMNGDIVLTFRGGEWEIRCSNNDIPFKDTEWFKANRTWPADGKK